MKKIVNHLVSTMTPLRVSLAGGGTDLPSFYTRQEGHVISLAINQHIYVTVKRHDPIFGEQYRISYSETEIVRSKDEIRNEIVKACLDFLEIQEPLYISTMSDLPTMSGLGSSSSFAVGLLNALHLMLGEKLSPEQLAHEACEIEILKLNKPIGKQDQYAAAFGGLNSIRFHKNQHVEVEEIILSKNTINLLNSLVLVWTGIRRKSESVLRVQENRVKENEEALIKLLGVSFKLKDELKLESNSMGKFAELISDAWKIKKKFSDIVSSAEIETLYDRCLSSGAVGGKLLGAGGGGFLLMCVPENRRDSFIRDLLPNFTHPVRIDQFGTRIISRISL